MNTIKELVAKYGEQYRKLIIDAVHYAEKQMPIWGVHLNIEEYIDELIKRTKLK